MSVRACRVVLVLGLLLAPAATATAQDAGASGAPATGAGDSGWPRSYSRAGSSITLHQPQVDSWADQLTLKFRMVLEVTPAGAKAPEYGVATVKADTHLDSSTRTVLLSGLVIDQSYPGMPDAQAAPLKALVSELLPDTSHLSLSLDRLLACMHDDKPPPPVAVSVAPPTIYVSSTPAILVVFIGPPRFQPVAGTRLMFATNTNWPVLLDGASDKYFLLDGSSWLTAPDPVAGPWTAAASLPADELAKLPAGAEWDDVRKALPGQPFTQVPKVFATTQPAELIVTDGLPEYAPISGTDLMYVSNPVMPLFMEVASGSFDLLVAGRWFHAASLAGPWSALSGSLPADFSRIPPDSPVASVLSSVPGTQPARDAVLLASVVHKATVDPSTAKLDVSYSGAPQFAAIDGTSMKYAVNTSYEVIEVAGSWYCCYQAVWFSAPAATGPWAVCSSVPDAIYTIPPDCPVYNVTYVRIYPGTGDAVVMGYSGGYQGDYVGPGGALVFGAGIVAWPAETCDACWASCSPAYYSYGCSAYYNEATGRYACGNAWYGPHGGAGWAAGYNPATGAWARGGYAYGPCGSYGFHEGYNPSTDTAAAHASAHNGYESWGSTAVSHGDSWMQAGHGTNAAGVTRGWAENSSGQTAEGVHAGNSTVAATSSGDLYAGHDGNAYRRTSDGTWQSYDRGSGWSDTAKQPGGGAPQPQAGGTPAWSAHDNQASLNRDAFSRNLGQFNQDRRFGGGGFGGAGGFRGRR